MAGRYGSAVYGRSTYGSPLADDVDVPVFSTTLTGHGNGVHLQWAQPVGTVMRVRLVRSLAGTPVFYDDGDVLVDEHYDDAPLEYVDTALTTGRVYYYALFVLERSNRWVRLVAQAVLVPKDYGYADRLYDGLPAVFKSSDFQTLEELEEDDERTSLLFRFMQLFGYQLDTTRAELEHLRRALEATAVHEKLLPALGQQVGVRYERQLGGRAMRRLTSNAVKLWGQKGTLPGVRGMANAVTGYPAVVRLGHNLALDHTAGPTGGAGRWYSEDADISFDSYATPQSDVVLGVEEGNQRANRLGVHTVSPLADTLTLTTNDGELEGKERAYQAIPVIAGLPYLVSQYFDGEAPTSTMTARAGIQWLDADGEPIGTPVFGTTGGTIRQGWLSRPTVSAVAPDNARYLEPLFQLANMVVGTDVVMSGFQVQESSTVRQWRPSREVLVYLLAEQINHIENTSGEVDAYGWAHPAKPPNLSQVSLLDALQVVGDGSDVEPATPSYVDSFENIEVVESLELGRYLTRVDPGDDVRDIALVDMLAVVEEGDTETPSTPQESYELSTVYYTARRPHVAPGQVWTALAEVLDTTLDLEGDDAPRTASVGLRMYDGPDLVGTAIGEPVGIFKDRFTQVRFEYVIPDDVAWDQIELTIVTTGAAGWRRAALVQDDSEDVFFFNGDSPSNTGDFVWEGTPHRSRSHYYPRRAVRASRLISLLRSYLPPEHAYRLVFGGRIVDSPRAVAGADIDPQSAPRQTVQNSLRMRWNTTRPVDADLEIAWPVAGAPVEKEVSLRWYSLAADHYQLVNPDADQATLGWVLDPNGGILTTAPPSPTGSNSGTLYYDPSTDEFVLTTNGLPAGTTQVTVDTTSALRVLPLVVGTATSQAVFRGAADLGTTGETINSLHARDASSNFLGAITSTTPTVQAIGDSSFVLSKNTAAGTMGIISNQGPFTNLINGQVGFPVRAGQVYDFGARFTPVTIGTPQTATFTAYFYREDGGYSQDPLWFQSVDVPLPAGGVVSVQVEAPSDAICAVLQLGFHVNSGTYPSNALHRIDDIVWLPNNNMIVNGGAELGTIEGWMGPSNDLGTEFLTSSTEKVRTGTRSFRAQSYDDNPNGLIGGLLGIRSDQGEVHPLFPDTLLIPVVAGFRYEVKGAGTTDGGWTGQFSLLVAWYSPTNLVSTPMVSTDSGTPVDGNAWAELSMTHTVPAGVTHASLYAQFTNMNIPPDSSTVAYFDDLSMRPIDDGEVTVNRVLRWDTLSGVADDLALQWATTETVDLTDGFVVE